MAKIEEKVKAFLSDEKKVKALASDEAFIKKVSGGTATPETYAEEFKKFGLKLSENEAKEVSETTTKLLNTPVEKLGDISLEKVSGGITKKDVGLASLIDVTGSAVVALGCSIASLVCQNKAEKYMLKGANSAHAAYSKASKALTITSISALGLAAIGTGALTIVYT